MKMQPTTQERFRRVRRGLCAIAIAMALLGSPPVAAQQGNPPPVGVDTVIKQAFSQTMPIIGRLVATRAGVVASRINGPVKAFLVDVGDRVEEGAPIAALVDDALAARRDLWEAELNEARGGVGTSQAELDLRRQELARLENLRDSAAFSQARLDDKRQEVAIIESELAEQRAAVGIAQANLRLAEINLYNAIVRAPYGGVVSARHTEVGAYVQAGGAVVNLIDDESLEIEADVPTDRISGLTPGREVAYAFADDVETTAWVRAVVPDENPLTRTRTVRFTAALPPNERLAANQSVTLRIPVGTARSVISVHKDAVLERTGGRMVIVAKDGKAEMRSVRLGAAIGERFEVLDGLSEGDVVVVRGNERLRPGQSISVGDALPAEDS